MREIKIDSDGLREEAMRAVEESPYTQADVARELDVTRTSVNHALRRSDPALEKLRCRIVELLTEYRVEKEVKYVLTPKEES